MSFIITHGTSFTTHLFYYVFFFKKNFYFNKLIPHKKDAKWKKSRRCDVCKIDVHRASIAKHLRSKKHPKKEKQNEMIIPEWLFQEPIENKPRKNIILNYYHKCKR